MKRIILILLTVSLIFPMTLLAQPDGSRGKRMKGDKREGSHIGHLLRLSEKLELSEKQMSELKQMAVDFQMERIDRKADLSKAKVTLRSLMRNENASQTDVEQNIDKVAALKANIKKMQYAHRKAVANLLSDKQKDKLKTLRKERENKFNGPPKHGRKSDLDHMQGKRSHGGRIGHRGTGR